MRKERNSSKWKQSQIETKTKYFATIYLRTGGSFARLRPPSMIPRSPPRGTMTHCVFIFQKLLDRGQVNLEGYFDRCLGANTMSQQGNLFTQTSTTQSLPLAPFPLSVTNLKSFSSLDVGGQTS